jgi:anti-anti-sigma factor
MPTESTDQVTIEIVNGSREGVRIIKIAGPLTIRNFFEFQEASREDRSSLLIVDLEKVPYMDSAALGSLLGLHVSCERHGRKYALVHVPERLQTMFAVCGVNEVLVTFPSIEAAEAARL